MEIIETSSIPKSRTKKNEDGLVITNDFVAVIDGSTSKTRRRFLPWMSNGRLAMLLISRYIRRMSADTSCHQFCTGVSRIIHRQYLYLWASWLTPDSRLQRLKEHPEERLTASAVIFSRKRRELWFVGDCQSLVGTQNSQPEDYHYFDNPKPAERHLAEMRGKRVKELMAEGMSETEQLKRGDPAREVIIQPLLESMREQNITFPVIDGFKIPEQLVPVIPLDFRPWEIILASDGYPFLCPTLAASEQRLNEQRENDPLNIRQFKATKAFIEGNNSFDDRTYVRFQV